MFDVTWPRLLFLITCQLFLKTLLCSLFLVDKIQEEGFSDYKVSNVQFDEHEKIFNVFENNKDESLNTDALRIFDIIFAICIFSDFLITSVV